MTATDAEIVQAARNLHDPIRNAGGREAQDVFDDPTAFDPGQHVLHDYSGTGDQAIEEFLPHAQVLATGFFLGWAVRTPAGS